MYGLTILIIAAVLLFIFLVRRWSLVSAGEVARRLEQGALIIDVRNPDEFAEGHIPRALNIPLSRLAEDVTARVPDRDQVLLLHCLAGGRSAVAQRLLRAKGYAHVYNLGSLSRARRLTAGKQVATPDSRPEPAERQERSAE